MQGTYISDRYLKQSLKDVIYLAMADLVVYWGFALYCKVRMDSWTFSGIISKDSTPNCLVSTDMCDYQAVSIFLISCLVWE